MTFDTETHRNHPTYSSKSADVKPKVDKCQGFLLVLLSAQPEQISVTKTINTRNDPHKVLTMLSGGV